MGKKKMVSLRMERVRQKVLELYPRTLPPEVTTLQI